MGAVFVLGTVFSVKRTWQQKVDLFEDVSPIEMGDFNCHVSSPEGNHQLMVNWWFGAWWFGSGKDSRK